MGGSDARALSRSLLDLCRIRKLTIATAESCTGGLVAAQLTEVPGSSASFRGGAVAYSNALKESLLGVSAGLLARHGAVSEECARAMAAGARERLVADAALAVTGIAGPAGGTKAKPVGLVYIAAAVPGRTEVVRRVFPGDRSQVRRRTATHALGLLRSLIRGR